MATRLCPLLVDGALCLCSAFLAGRGLLALHDPLTAIRPLPPLAGPARGDRWGGLEPLAPPPELVALVAEEMGNVLGGAASAGGVRVVLVDGAHARSCGSSRASSGAVLGVPLPFLEPWGYDIREIWEAEWEGERGRELRACLSPSRDAVRWAVAHELAHVKGEDFAARAMLPSLCLLAYHAMAKLAWRAGRMRGGLAARACVLALGPSASFAVSVALNRSQEYRADAVASAVSDEHRRGGAERLEQAIRLEGLLGGAAASWITHPPLSDRLAAQPVLLEQPDL